jgi:hypothetical protein
MAVLAAVGFAEASASATTVIGASYHGVTWWYATEALGQKFTAPVTDHYLTEFTMAGVKVDTSSGLPVTFHIAPWSGSAPGADLYTVPLGTIGLDPVPVVADPGWLDLTPGGTYVAYVTTPPSLHPVASLISSGYDSGSFVFYDVDAGWLGSPQFIGSDADLMFTAQFEVPEPLGLGVVSGAAGMAGLLRRRKRK